MSEEKEVKPCPLCGKAPVTQSLHVSIWVTRCTAGNHIIEARGKTRDEAITAWNTRHDEGEIPEWVMEKVKYKIQSITDEYKMTTNLNLLCDEMNKKSGLKWVLSLKRDK